MEKDVIEREDEVIVIDGDGDSHTFLKEDDKVTPGDADPEVVKWLVHESDTRFSRPLSDFPIEFSYWVHLEDSVKSSFLTKNRKSLPESFAQQLELPSIEMQTEWRVHQDGTMELKNIKYNQKTYAESGN